MFGSWSVIEDLWNKIMTPLIQTAESKIFKSVKTKEKSIQSRKETFTFIFTGFDFQFRK